MRNLTSLVLHDLGATGTLVASIFPLALIFSVQPLPPEPTAALVVVVTRSSRSGCAGAGQLAEGFAS